MNRWIVWLVLSIAPMAAVAQSSAAPRVVFYRAPYGIRGFSGSAPVWIDGTESLDLMPGYRATAQLAPGKHALRAAAKSYVIVLDAKPGQTYYVRFDVNTSGAFGTKFLTQVDPETAKAQCERTVVARRSAVLVAGVFIEPAPK